MPAKASILLGRRYVAVGFALIVSAAYVCGQASASTCVTTADELTSALLAAQQDTANTDEIRVHTGHYLAPNGGWNVDVQQRGITIAGGYTDAGCQTQSLDASLTVLDGHQAVRPLTIDTSFAGQQTTTAITISGFTFENGSGDPFGGLKVSDSGPIYLGNILVERNIFRDNNGIALSAATDGLTGDGAVYLIARNNLFTGNRAKDAAAASLFSNNGIDVIGNTVTGNQSFDATQPTRTMFSTFTFSQITYSDNIFWNNNPDNLAGSFDIRADSPFRADLDADLFNNDMQAISGAPGMQAGNVAVDPQFIDASAGNFRLASTSPLIDAGFDTPLGNLSNTDLDGLARLQGKHVDMGAFESDGIFHNGFE
jgi:hypothetical protein